MKDAISVGRLQKLHPKVKDTFQKFIEECEAKLNVVVRITQGLRTFPEQQTLYDQGRTVEGKKKGKIVTNAKAGQSLHNFALAVDLCIMVGGTVNWNYNMAELAKIGHKYGIEWGGDWTSIKDYPHFQITFNHTWQQLLALHNSGEVDKDGYVLI